MSSHVGVTRAFLGMPEPLPKFPDAAREALTDSVQRRNLAHATGLIRAKRAEVVGERREGVHVEAVNRRVARPREPRNRHVARGHEGTANHAPSTLRSRRPTARLGAPRTQALGHETSDRECVRPLSQTR